MSRVKLRVLEECSICQMIECLAIVITQETQVKYSYCFYVQGKNDESELFYDNSEFPDVNFCLVPKNNNLDFYICIWGHAWK